MEKEQRIIISGFGGQGILFTGSILAYAAIFEDKNATWMPSYGAEMRGGTANCSVKISNEEIASPYVEKPDDTIIFNIASMRKFEPRMQSGGLMIINSALLSEERPTRNDITCLAIPVNEIAKEAGDVRAANMVALGAFIQTTGIVTIDSIKKALSKVLPPEKKKFISINNQALYDGANFVKKISKQNSMVS